VLEAHRQSTETRTQIKPLHIHYTMIVH